MHTSRTSRTSRSHGGDAAQPDLVSHAARLPGGYTCRFRLTNARRLDVEWYPAIPRRFRSQRAKRKFLDHYWRARRVFAEQVATVVGGNVAFLDVDDSAGDVKLLGVDISTPLAKH